MLPWTGPVGGWRIRSSSYSSTIRTGSLFSRTHVAMPDLAGVPRLQVVLRVDAPGDDRREQPRQLVDELDRDVVRADQLAQAIGDRAEEHRRVERRQDRLGDLEELALAADLLLQGGRLLAQPLGRVRVCQVDLGVLQRHRCLGCEQLGQLELVVGEQPALADAFDRQPADRAVAAPQGDTDETAVGWARSSRDGPWGRRTRRRSGPVRCARPPTTRARPGQGPTAAGSARHRRRARRRASGARRSCRPARSRMLSEPIRSPSRSAIVPSRTGGSRVVRIDSVISSSSRWPRTFCSSAADCSRRRSVASALAIACAAKLA